MLIPFPTTLKSSQEDLGSGTSSRVDRDGFSFAFSWPSAFSFLSCSSARSHASHAPSVFLPLLSYVLNIISLTREYLLPEDVSGRKDRACDFPSSFLWINCFLLAYPFPSAYFRALPRE